MALGKKFTMLLLIVLCGTLAAQEQATPEQIYRTIRLLVPISTSQPIQDSLDKAETIPAGVDAKIAQQMIGWGDLCISHFEAVLSGAKKMSGNSKLTRQGIMVVMARMARKTSKIDQILDLLFSQLREKDKDIRKLAIIELGIVAQSLPDKKERVAAPLKILAANESVKEVNQAVLLVLRTIGVDVKVTVPEGKIAQLIARLYDRTKMEPVSKSLVLENGLFSVKCSGINLAAAAELTAIGEPAVPQLLQAIRDSESTRKWGKAEKKCILMVLSQIGHHAEVFCDKIVAEFIQALADEEKQLKKLAIVEVGLIGPKAEKTIEYLIQALANNDWEFRNNALFALSKMQSKAVPAVPHIIRALQDKNGVTRQYAVICLGEIGADAKAALQPLLTILRNDNNADVKKSAIQAIGKLGAEAKTAVPELIGYLGSKSKDLQREAVLALKTIGKPGLEDLQKAVPRVRQSEIKSLLEEIIQSIKK